MSMVGLGWYGWAVSFFSIYFFFGGSLQCLVACLLTMQRASRLQDVIMPFSFLSLNSRSSCPFFFPLTCNALFLFLRRGCRFAEHGWLALDGNQQETDVQCFARRLYSCMYGCGWID
ncbi:hypothetical protein IWZ00DRAFT_297753 [Phyllosticta capitalensis]